MKNKVLIITLLLAPQWLVLSQSKQWSYKECFEYALNNNISIKQKSLSKDMTALNLEKAKASYIPTLNASTNHNLSFGRSLDSYTNNYISNNTYSNDYSLSSSLTLFNGFQNSLNVKMYRTNLEAEGYDLEKMKNDVMINVLQAYLQILLAEEQLTVARESVKSSQALVDRTEKLVKAGNKAMNDLLQVKSQLSSDQYTLTVRENSLQMAKVSLMQLMELPVDTSFRITPPAVSATAATVPDASQAFESAVNTLPEVRSADLRIKSGEYSYEAAKGAALPRVTLSGNINTGYSNARSLYEFSDPVLASIPIGYLGSNHNEIVYNDVMNSVKTEKDYPYMQQLGDNLRESVSLGISIPILQNKQIRTNKALAKIELENDQLTAQTTRNTLRKTIEQNVTDLMAARNNRESAAEQLASAQESYRSAEAKYALGMVNSTDLLVEKKTLMQAESNLIQAKYEEMFQSRIMDFYLGNNIDL